MTKTFTLLTLACSLAAATAQESIPQDQLEKVAPRLAERAADQETLPMKASVDAAKAVGMKIKDYGAILLPAKGLSKETLANGEKKILPIGHLWLKALAPKGHRETLRTVTVQIDRSEQTLVLVCLGMRMTGAGGPELVIYGKDKEPVAALPLKKVDRNQAAPVELNMQSGTGSLGEIELDILGQYQGRIAVDEYTP